MMYHHETISPKMDWLIDWLIDYGNLQKQVWWEFTARKNAGISEKFCGKVLQKSFMGKFFGKVLQKVLRKSFKGKFFGKVLQKVLRGNFTKKFYGEMGSQVWIETWKGCWSVTAPVRVTVLLASPDSPNFLTNKKYQRTFIFPFILTAFSYIQHAMVILVVVR